MHGLGVHQICNVYGATETYGNATVTDASEPEAVRLQSQGTPLPGMRLRIVHPDTRAVLPPGEVGEILVAGRVTPGYYRDPEHNARAFDAEGYFLTGDLGMLDAAGRLHFRGRLKDLIKAGGINISPLEVEAYSTTAPEGALRRRRRPPRCREGGSPGRRRSSCGSGKRRRPRRSAAFAGATSPATRSRCRWSSYARTSFRGRTPGRSRRWRCAR